MSVHGSHCCKECGCKYGNKDCPVVLGTERAIYKCFDCGLRLKKIQKLAIFLEESFFERSKAGYLKEAELIYNFIKKQE